MESLSSRLDRLEEDLLCCISADDLVGFTNRYERLAAEVATGVVAHTIDAETEGIAFRVAQRIEVIAQSFADLEVEASGLRDQLMTDVDAILLAEGASNSAQATADTTLGQSDRKRSKVNKDKAHSRRSGASTKPSKRGSPGGGAGGGVGTAA